MANATWKNAERRIARAVGGRRIGNTGRATADVDAGWLAVEVKQRKRLPVWLTSALAQARRNAGDGQLAIVTLHERYARDSLVLMALSDFCEWFGDNGQSNGDSR